MVSLVPTPHGCKGKSESVVKLLFFWYLHGHEREREKERDEVILKSCTKKKRQVAIIFKLENPTQHVISLF